MNLGRTAAMSRIVIAHRLAPPLYRVRHALIEPILPVCGE